MLPPDLRSAATRTGEALRVRNETVAVAEGSCGGLVSASLLAVPGASAFYAGGAVIYTLAASRAFLAGAVPTLSTQSSLRSYRTGYSFALCRRRRGRLRAPDALNDNAWSAPNPGADQAIRGRIAPRGPWSG